MKFTLDWLREHLDTSASADEVATALTSIGLEVESVTDQASRLSGFVVGYVVSAEQHPNADRLRVCKVDAGTGEIVDVVCGAPNARTGIKSVFAFAGTYIPGKDVVLQKGVIRGAPSNGMLCSAFELELSEDHDGIIELPDDAPVGMRYVDYAGLNEVVIDIAVTPNRGDATGVYGIARDLAAFGLGTLRDGAVPSQPSPGGKGSISVSLDFPAGAEACKMFAGRLITGVKNGPSPDWLSTRLKAIGLRPINTLVDITNLVCHDRGRPLHVFDADKLSGNITARMAKSGETLLALDNKTYTLDENICVIADDSKALGVAGIIGGEETGCTDTTTNVFIESAWFEPNAIATAGRKLGIVSDARYRFERYVDPATVLPGLELATRLITELCGGVVHEPVVAGHVEGAGTVVDFPLSEVKRLTGLDLPEADITGALTRLGFGVGPVVSGRASVSVPSWRPDVTHKADLAEEVMRMTGVDRVPVEPLPRATHVAKTMLTPIQNRRRLARRLLAARGLDEAVTWSFISEPEAKAFGGGDAALKLANPIAAELTDMRPSLLPGLLAAARRNANRGFPDLALFEVGQVFLTYLPEGQKSHASGIRAGGSGRHWSGSAEKVSVFDAKADLFALLETLGLDPEKLQLVAEAPHWSHPGRGGRLQLGPKVTLGGFGELHPRLLEQFDLTGPVVGFELDLDAIPEPKKRPTKGKPALKLSDLMPLTRDFAFLVDRSVSAATLLKAARGADKTLVSGVEVFDVFEGAALGGQKSVGLAVTLQPVDHTLAEAEIEAVSARIVVAVEKATGGKLRG